jgi:hypothetical protein
MAWLRRATKERRDSERVDVVWTGRCGPGRTPEWEWSECALVDNSAHGVRLLVAPTTRYRVGADVAIAVERLGDTSVGLRLHGRVRHVRTDDDGTHVGVDLTFATPQEQRTAEMLFGSGH